MLSKSDKNLAKFARQMEQRVSAALISEIQEVLFCAAEIARPRRDTEEARIQRAAKALSIGLRRARTFWYGDPASVRADEIERIRSRSKEVLAAYLRRLDAEREITAARLAALETTKNAALATRGSVLDQVGEDGAGARRVVQEPVARPSVKRG